MVPISVVSGLDIWLVIIAYICTARRWSQFTHKEQGSSNRWVNLRLQPTHVVQAYLHCCWQGVGVLSLGLYESCLLPMSLSLRNGTAEAEDRETAFTSPRLDGAGTRVRSQWYRSCNCSAKKDRDSTFSLSLELCPKRKTWAVTSTTPPMSAIPTSLVDVSCSMAQSRLQVVA